MNIWIYDNILQGAKEYNSKNKLYNNQVVGVAPLEPKYPLTVIDEVRNVSTRSYNTPYDKTTSNGYRVDVFAQDKGKKSKQEIAREIAQSINTYLCDYVGLHQVSYNVMPSVNDNSLYHITMMYEGTLHINRAKFI